MGCTIAQLDFHLRPFDGGRLVFLPRVFQIRQVLAQGRHVQYRQVLFRIPPRSRPLQLLRAFVNVLLGHELAF
jgi:hypothetical protein